MRSSSSRRPPHADQPPRLHLDDPDRNRTGTAWTNPHVRPEILDRCDSDDAWPAKKATQIGA
jgi:hypothetical protein